MLIEDVLPGALAIGVPYETFWHINPIILKSYEKAYRLKADVEAQQTDATAWLHGVYTSMAIGAVLSRGKSRYPSKPKGYKNSDETIESKVTRAEQMAARINSKIRAQKGNK